MAPIFELIREMFFFAGYLAEHDRFPKPLTADEEREQLRRYKEEGDEAARAKLIEHNMRLVVHISKKYAASEDRDDLIGIGTMGLIKGVNTFDPKHGTQLGTYIARCIENEMLMYLRAGKRMQAEVSLGETVGEDKEGNRITLMDILPSLERDVSEQAEIQIHSEKLGGMLKKVLTPRENTVIRLRYGLDGGGALTQHEIAERLGISRSYISRIEKHAIEKLAAEFDVQR